MSATVAAKSMLQRPEASAADRRLEPEPPAWPLLEAAVWPVAAIAFILCGVAARLVGGESAGDLTWSIGLAVAATPIAWRTLVDARQGRFATDIVATLAIVGALLLREPLAGLVVVLMKRGGDALERYAEGKASAAVRALEAAAPRVAHLVKGTSVVDVAATAVEVGDLLLIRPGELIPCDGVIEDGVSDLDTSSLTGEPVPVVAGPGVAAMSGSANGAGVLHLRASAVAAQSQYARIVELVRSAESHKAPLQRIADRYAVWFTPITVLTCIVAFAATRDWTRVLAILVVATPCPLILATPVAFVGGINRAARRHIIIRNGGALEQLSAVSTVVFDKTGTITVGEPHLDRVETVGAWTADELLRFAAGVEQGSSHRLARVVVDAATAKGLTIPAATAQTERPGQGVSGTVEGHAVHVGSRAFVLSRSSANGDLVARLEERLVALRAYVGIDGQLVGAIEYADALRADVPVVLRRLASMGVRHVVLLSGDHASSARQMAERAGIADVRGDLLPEDKATVVQALIGKGEVVMMVGDGTNDAPALSSASVGVALAGHGGGITAEAAQVIILRDAIDAVSEVVAIGRRTMRIARQSIWVGLGLSGLAMIWAAFGGIAPVAGAILQEAIDVAVIVNALRTIRGTP